MFQLLWKRHIVRYSQVMSVLSDTDRPLWIWWNKINSQQNHLKNVKMNHFLSQFLQWDKCFDHPRAVVMFCINQKTLKMMTIALQTMTLPIVDYSQPSHTSDMDCLEVYVDIRKYHIKIGIHLLKHTNGIFGLSFCTSVKKSQIQIFQAQHTNELIPRFSQLPRLAVMTFKPAEEPDKGNVHLVMFPDPPDPSLGRV